VIPCGWFRDLIFRFGGNLDTINQNSVGTLVGILIVIVILGALLGGKGFGSVVRRGCGFVLLLIIGAVVIIFIGVWYDQSATITEPPGSNRNSLSTDNGAYFQAKETCPIYSKPDIDSDTLDFLKFDSQIWVENPDRYKYFYTLIENNQDVGYVRKGCFEK
jgi:hypothetical protein